MLQRQNKTLFQERSHIYLNNAKTKQENTKYKATLEVEKLKCNRATPAHINYTEEQLRVVTYRGKNFNVCSMSIAKIKRIPSKYISSRNSSTFQTLQYNRLFRQFLKTIFFFCRNQLSQRMQGQKAKLLTMFTK